MDHTRHFRSHLARRLLLAACLTAGTFAIACETTVTTFSPDDDGSAGGGGNGEGGACTTSSEFCGDGGAGAQGGWPSSGSSTWTEVQCFEWPPVEGGGGSGGAGAAGGTGGRGAGGMGGLGPGPEPPPCPDAANAAMYLPDSNIGCSYVQGFAAEQMEGSCCYDVLFDCGVGRPYTYEGGALAAEARWGEASEWIDDEAPCVDALTPELRELLAEAWCRDGMYEHASVASFARFAMELMAVGAPPDLIAAAHVAAADEVRHAKACLSLAAGYAGRPLAPSAFPFDGHAVVSSDLAEIAARAAYEGCVGETVAAIQAAEQLSTARDPRVRAALSSIAEEEAQHAELAWKTVAWAIERGGDEVRGAVGRAIEAAIVELLVAPEDAPSDDDVARHLEAHGRLDATRIAALRRRAIHDVVAPCAERLLAVKCSPHAELVHDRVG